MAIAKWMYVLRMNSDRSVVGACAAIEPNEAYGFSA
jgi:hypothetical protein